MQQVPLAMHRFHAVRRLSWIVLGWLCLATVPALGQFDQKKLTDYTTLTGQVKAQQMTPDGSRVVFIANPLAVQAFELFSAPIAGGPVTRLSPPLTPGGEVREFILSPDGSRALFLANSRDFDRLELFIVDVVGGPTVQLSDPAMSTGDVLEYAFSPDGQRVVFRADRSSGFDTDLFSVASGGGAVTRLSPAVSTILVFDFAIAPDSSRVVFRSNQGTTIDLFSVPLAGGAAVQLNDALGSGRRVDGYVIHPDSSQVIFDSEVNTFLGELFSAPIAGGANQSMALDDIDDFGGDLLISPDGQYLVFLADIGSETRELLRLNLTTLDVDNLSVSTSGVLNFQITPDGTRVVFIANQPGASVETQLRVAALAGGASVLLNPTQSTAETLGEPRFSADGSRILFTADVDGPGLPALFGVPAAGGSTERLSPVVAMGDGVTDYAFDSDGETVIYLLDRDEPEVTELFSVPWNGDLQTQLNQELPPGGVVESFVVRSGNVAFTAPGNLIGVTELHRVSVDGGVVDTLSDPPVGVAGSALSPQLSADDSTLIYLVREGGLEAIYSYSLDDSGAPEGSGDPILLDQAENPGDFFRTRVFDPSGQRLVYLLQYADFTQGRDLFSVSLTGGPVVRLNDPADGEVGSFQVTADGQFVVYTARIGGGTRHLFSVPLTGGAIQQISDGSFVGSFRLAADGGLVVFESPELFSSPIRDGGLTQLTADEVTFWNISPDSSPVAYFDNTTGGIFTVPTAGGSATEIQPNNGGRPVFTTDGQRLLYMFSPGVLDNLFSLPVVGGGSVQLNDRNQHTGRVVNYVVSPDNSRVVMRMDVSNQPYMLASTPIVGGPMTVLEELPSPPPPVGTGVMGFDVTADNQQVLYVVNRADGGGGRLFRIPIDGGEGVRLNPIGSVQSFVLSEDGSRVYYRFNPPSEPEIVELAMVPVANDAPAALVHPPLAPRRTVSQFVVTSDGRTVVYIADQDADNVFDVYISRLNGMLFGNGFESGTTDGWSGAVP